MTGVLTTINKADLTVGQPKGVSLKFTDNDIARINDLLKDEKLQENFSDNLIDFMSVAREGKFKVSSYINAAQYVSYKLLGDTNERAYAKVFPTKYNELIQDEANSQTISAYVAGYNKSKLVGLMLGQARTPLWVHNHGTAQKAINVLANKMVDEDVSHKVQVEAATALLTHLKQPEAKKVEMDIVVSTDDSLKQFQQAAKEYAEQQREAIKAKTDNVQDVAHSKILAGPNDIDHEP